ncbi:Wzz/FepE/Etk N-terminal domain-containing protein [Massilia solisilvae]|uniref:Wzz/FepE/Etk N-terminal domain-containing protein n=1 Tax=Massilia solisilvae TaxID=1811225 RepID=A0ABT2BFZ8_9BURK|nr:Wzz/FepE/Etk N-terminal domain-containing protein [Massilia solisilvae]MCS0606975.1 Wzz/FepE/Etk N-terminal domain-containing protein [Massilia solisilvae]
MNQVQSNANGQSNGEDQISLIDLLIVLAKHKKLVAGLPLVAAALAVAISLVLPNVYKADAKLLPPQQAQSGAAALLSQLGGMAGAAAGVAGIKNPNDLYIGMLKSRTIAAKLIQKFDLTKVYNTQSQEVAMAKLAANTAISAGKDNLITIEVHATDRKLVAPLANAYVSELLALTKVMAVTEAGQRRVFYERQLEQAKNNLARGEAALKGALDARGVISVDTESRAVIETVGRLRAQVSAKEIQLNSMRAFVTPSNPQYMRVDEELASLRAELDKLENGRAGAGSAPASGAGPKQSGFDNIMLLRDVKYYQMLYELLAKQYEAARLDEAKDPSVIQVLDPAVEPERKFKPNRTLIVVLTTMVALLVAIAIAFLSEARRKALSSEAGAARWRELKQHLALKR